MLLGVLVTMLAHMYIIYFHGRTLLMGGRIPSNLNCFLTPFCILCCLAPTHTLACQKCGLTIRYVSTVMHFINYAK